MKHFKIMNFLTYNLVEEKVFQVRTVHFFINDCTKFLREKYQKHIKNY